ncbi:hypothetical protein [Tsukamurella tyrosinosolvens]|uniref:hypothetical protein n=1 Tax=Tsukamurella tyrosinosolvens TaxID=57704 RepID=UPI000CA1E8DE|nr:hypothetical protein [Tsukamurella tyrosinosolvens]AUN38646.1 hypothetical protein ASU32_00320 [Tsukamurella tyrosinosolvens]
MAYVIQYERGGWFEKDRWKVGYHSPDGEWRHYSTWYSSEEAEEEVNLLNGGNAAATRRHLEAQSEAELALEQERRATAEQVAANLAERERLLAEQAHQQDLERAKWAAAQKEDRRRAQEEAAEQLRRYPPTMTVVEGGSAAWNGAIEFQLSNGGTITVAVSDLY